MFATATTYVLDHCSHEVVHFLHADDCAIRTLRVPPEDCTCFVPVDLPVVALIFTMEFNHLLAFAGLSKVTFGKLCMEKISCEVA